MRMKGHPGVLRQRYRGQLMKLLRDRPRTTLSGT